MSDLKDFLENIRKFSPKIGEVAMRHVSSSCVVIIIVCQDELLYSFRLLECKTHVIAFLIQIILNTNETSKGNNMKTCIKNCVEI